MFYAADIALQLEHVRNLPTQAINILLLRSMLAIDVLRERLFVGNHYGQSCILRLRHAREKR